MKNTKFLKPIIALSLVGAMAVGGTLAYINAETDAYTNEFTFAHAGEDASDVLAITLDETFKDAKGNAVAEVLEEGEGTGVYATTFMPGDTFSKIATVKLTENELADGAYVFVLVNGNTDASVTYSVDSKWTKVAGYTDLYKLTEGTDSIVNGANTTGWTVLTENKVSIATDATVTELADVEIDIKIDAYAVQVANLSYNEAVALAATNLGATPAKS